VSLVFGKSVMNVFTDTLGILLLGNKLSLLIKYVESITNSLFPDVALIRNVVCV
jgi:hypothetical protein